MLLSRDHAEVCCNVVHIVLLDEPFCKVAEPGCRKALPGLVQCPLVPDASWVQACPDGITKGIPCPEALLNREHQYLDKFVTVCQGIRPIRPPDDCMPQPMEGIGWQAPTLAHIGNSSDWRQFRWADDRPCSTVSALPPWHHYYVLCREVGRSKFSTSSLNSLVTLPHLPKP